MKEEVEFMLIAFALKSRSFIVELLNRTREDYYLKTRGAYKILGDYYTTYKGIPSFDVIISYIDENQTKYNNINDAKSILKNAYSVDKTKLIDGDFQYLIGELKKQYNNRFLKERVESLSVKLNRENNNIDELNEYIKKTYFEINNLKNNHIYAQGSLQETAKDYWAKYNEIRENPDLAKGIYSGFRELDEITNGFRDSEVIIVSGSSGCHAKGQGILMYDGTIKKVEDIVIGDQLMGPDSKPRNVLKLCRGNDDMYEVIPVKGKSFVVNGEHILSLQRSDNTSKLAGTIIDVSVNDWLKWPKKEKSLYKLFRTKVDFSNTNTLPIEPYLLGIYLGDGSSRSGAGTIQITTGDLEIRQYIFESAKVLGLSVSKWSKKGTDAVSFSFTGVKGRSNIFAEKLKELNVYKLGSEDKYIPYNYKISSYENRLQILAGLIDTDGSIGCNVYDFISKSKQLAEDVCFISRSVGLSAYMRDSWKCDQNGKCGWYYRVCISGNIDIIPVKIGRKKATSRKQIKSVLRTGFEIKKLNCKDNYYGFILDQDHRYLLDDFTVTHNSGKSILLMNMGINAWLGNNKITNPIEHCDNTGKNVWFISIENPFGMMRRRIDSCISGIASNRLRDGTWDVIEDGPSLKQSLQFQAKYGKQFYVSDLGRGVTMNMIEAEYEKLISKFTPDMIVIDYLGIMNANNPTGKDWLDQGTNAEDMCEFARQINKPILSASQLKAALRTNGGLRRFTGDLESVARSKMITDNVNINLHIDIDDEDTYGEGIRYDDSPYMKIVIAKCRDSSKGSFVIGKEFWRQRVYDLDITNPKSSDGRYIND